MFNTLRWLSCSLARSLSRLDLIYVVIVVYAATDLDFVCALSFFFFAYFYLRLCCVALLLLLHLLLLLLRHEHKKTTEE